MEIIKTQNPDPVPDLLVKFNKQLAIAEDSMFVIASICLVANAFLLWRSRADPSFRFIATLLFFEAMTAIAML